jgi:hypothetical protein
MRRLHQLRKITHGNWFLYKKKKKKLIGVKWIYKEKKNAKREKKRYKARLEEKSYSQKQGINYNEVFALLNNIKGKLQEIKDMQT